MKPKLRRAGIAMLEFCGTFFLGAGTNMVTADWHSPIGWILVGVGLFFGGGGLVWIIVDLWKSYSPPMPAIIIRDAEFTQMIEEGNEVWYFSILLNVTPAADDRFLIDADDCSVRITPEKDASMSSDSPLTFLLRNVRKNDGPIQPGARVEDAALLKFEGRRHVRLVGSLPKKFMARVNLIDSHPRLINVPPVLLIQPEANVKHWSGYGNATEQEIAEMMS